MSPNQFVQNTSFTATVFLPGFTCHVPQAGRNASKTVGPCLLVIQGLNDLRGNGVLLVG